MTAYQPEHDSDRTWLDEAACCAGHVDVALFYPAEPDVVTPEAARVCAGCPVRDECLDHAVHHEQYGTWAGMSESARERLRRSLRVDIDRPEGRPGVRFVGGGHEDVPTVGATPHTAFLLHQAGMNVTDIAAVLDINVDAARALINAGYQTTPTNSLGEDDPEWP